MVHSPKLIGNKLDKNKQKAVFYGLVSLLTLMVIFSVVWSLRKIACGTHDDLNMVFEIRSMTLIDYLKTSYAAALARGRISILQIFVLIPYYMVIRSGNQILYSLIVYIPIVANVIFFSYIIWRNFNKHLAMLIPVFFFTFVQVDSFHNLMVSYPIQFQVGFFTFLIGIQLMLRYQAIKKEHFLWISALLMYDSFSAYESFVGYFLVFLLIALFYSFSKEGARKFDYKIFIKQIKYHLIAVILFIGFYFLARKLAPVNYGGNTIDASSFNIKAAIKTLFTFTYSLFPLREFFSDSVYKGFELALLSPRMLLKAFSACICFSIIILKSEKIKTSWLFTTIFISTVAGLIFCIPHSLTPQYQAWVKLGVKGFVPSFFSYYWIVLPLSAISIYICNSNKKLKMAICIIMSFGVFFGSLFTDFSNNQTIINKTEDTIRYKMFDKFVKTEQYKQLESDAVIYVEGYTGIHNNILSLGQYGAIYAKKNYRFTNDINEAMDHNHKYYLRYDQQNRTIYFARLTDLFIGDALYILSYDNVSSGKYAHFNKIPEEMAVYMNQTFIGTYMYSVTIPNEDSVDGETITTSNILLNTCTLTNTLSADNKLISTKGVYKPIDNQPNVQYASGWYPKEDWGIWSLGKKSYILILMPKIKNDAHIIMDINVLKQPGGLGVDILSENYILFKGNITESGIISFSVPKTCFMNKSFLCLTVNIENPISPADLNISVDARNLGVGVKSISVSYENN